MDLAETEKLVKQLSAGFETLQDEYQKLHNQHQALERKLATARDQYNELAKLCGSGALTTPPLSLSSSPAQPGPPTGQQSVVDILQQIDGTGSTDAAGKVRDAVNAAKYLEKALLLSRDIRDGVRIWSGPSADRPEPTAKKMESISESPLEQDFTIEGKPSKLGCPFASMANKKLSSHAASVLGRYNGAAPSTPRSSVSRINGKESFSRKGDERSSFVDPIKAEICGLSDHDEESPYSERAMKAQHHEKQDGNDVGVCPIRFLDQHSPEEVATYFEKHKHELPRSHEICVKRYQSNEKQIRELDAKYGTLVSMIQGLGAKHKDFLPREPEDGTANGEEDAKDDEKVRKWASSVSALHAEDGKEALDYDDDDEEARQQHFERPLRDIRVGESPSRPWGIHVPSGHAERRESQASNKPDQFTKPPVKAPQVVPQNEERNAEQAKCPIRLPQAETQDKADARKAPAKADSKPTFVNPGGIPVLQDSDNHNDDSRRIVFTGPVFIGYSAEDAAKILQNSGLGTR